METFALQVWSHLKPKEKFIQERIFLQCVKNFKAIKERMPLYSNICLLLNFRRTFWSPFALFSRYKSFLCWVAPTPCLHSFFFFWVLSKKFIFKWKSQTKSLIHACSLPTCPQSPGLGQAEANSGNLSLGLPQWWQRPKKLSHHLLFPKEYNSKELELIGIRTQVLWYGIKCP